MSETVTAESLVHAAADALDRIRDRTPLIHNITNYVVMNLTANALLHIGASPVMAHAVDEVAEMVGYAGALVLNVGTLEDAWVEAMIVAGKEANHRGTPVVLDPVGMGATGLRTRAVGRILDEVHVAIVRGNAAELAATAGLKAEIRGVDSVAAESPELAVRRVAARTGGAAVASGVADVVADATRVALVENGHKLMGAITGSGCTSTAIVGAFAAVEPDPFVAATSAMIAFGIAGEIAAHGAGGPGTFQARLMDAIYHLDAKTIRAQGRVSVRTGLGPAA